ncbi:TPA: DNA-methyltransferase [Burkholderia contaminans]|uniref:DNA-methyltransferase n=1 Tax=Burkholderia contaminans TaxID=488447 RepID=UPI000D00E905|nr:site-specific DNA-methyltransferase [Burkholderia contaminans]HDR9065495.1 site-specific DNA-methyltransferase [Burkholderia vietnamiensis]MBM6427934.1 site-specific DNA-methyltransferase [Burkholderia contaminans]MCA7876765.1 site-specific DNA-methyltransferase [Burkholderia contaminans]MDN8024212.1 DNA methyltransferase [Burkholderia contaminans]PRG12211.1 cytosine methyltransferase [Burkholderia contaminans]
MTGRPRFDLRLGDCLELMKDLPDESVDMVLCDLPYGTTSRNKWDSVIPFDPLWEQYRRVAKKGAAIVLTASQPFTTALIASNLKDFRYCWIWEKTRAVGFLSANRQPMRKHEDVAVFSVGAAPPYNPQGLVPCGKKVKRAAVGDNYQPAASNEYVQAMTNYPTTVVRFASEGKPVHPTQKPVALMEYMIRTYTDEGAVVLDNCMGSGTTGVAALMAGRRFIGMEQEERYFDIAVERVRQTVECVAATAERLAA